MIWCTKQHELVLFVLEKTIDSVPLRFTLFALDIEQVLFANYDLKDKQVQDKLTRRWEEFDRIQDTMNNTKIENVNGYYKDIIIDGRNDLVY
jgi:hypothetical protein